MGIDNGYTRKCLGSACPAHNHKLGCDYEHVTTGSHQAEFIPRKPGVDSCTTNLHPDKIWEQIDQYQAMMAAHTLEIPHTQKQKKSA